MKRSSASVSSLRPREGRSRLGMSQGMALFYLADKYPLLEDVVCELIQNALDAGADWIRVTYNKAKRRLAVVDNGNGTSIDNFNDALQQICTTQKDEYKLGRFGIGLISPLGKCRQFSFTSCAKDSPHEYNMWTFDSEQIKIQKTEVTVPRIELPASFARDGGGKVQAGRSLFPWRTRTVMMEVTQDRHVSKLSIDSIERRLYESYNKTMIDLATLVEIEIVEGKVILEQKEIRGRKFRGKKLQEYIHRSGDGAVTYFKLGIAPLSGKVRDGKVKLGEVRNDFRIGLAALSRSGTGRLISQEALAALQSGYFEGEITDTKVELHVSRKSFVENDALLNLGIAVETWYEAVGKQLMEEFVTDSREERYQRMGENSARFFDAAMRDERFEDFRKGLLKGLLVGTIGRGHADAGGKVLGPQDGKSVVAVGTPPGTGREREYDDHSGGNPKHDAPDHAPTIVHGPRGQRRMKVRGDSQGLQFAYDHTGSMSPKLWDFDFTDGMIVINTLHPLWAELEGKGSETRLGRFQELIAIYALMYANTTPDWHKILLSAGEDFFKLASFWLANADQITGRFGGGRPPKVKK